MMGYAFWINNETGEAIYCPRKHIDVILDYPEIFGFTKDELWAIYDKYGERFRLEGKAREEILKKAIDKGWIRVRKYMGNMGETITFNVPALTRDVKDTLSAFAMKLLNGVDIKSPNGIREHIKDYPQTKVTIADGSGNILLTTDLESIAEYKFEEARSGLAASIYSRLGLERKELIIIHAELLNEQYIRIQLKDK